MGVHPGEVRVVAATPALDELQRKIGIHFRDPSLLLEALTHSSFANESPHISPRDNERLEYLGDAVLQLITAEHLYKLRSDANEGEMTQIRSSMVNTNTLAHLAEQLDMGSYLYLGKGIAKGGGRNLKSLLANAFEALLGAIFLDAGYEAAYHYYLDRYRGLPEGATAENFKGRLQQVVQERFGNTPYYDSEGARVGSQREYTSVVFADSEPLGTGHGATKQEAEQEAAKAALVKLLGDGAANVKPAAKPRSPRTRSRRPPAKAPGSEVVDSDSAGTDANAARTEPPPILSEPTPEPAPEPPRSRQFGAPIDDSE